jgi:hypothetical protein
MGDFILPDPTAGEEESARPIPYAPSSVGDIMSSNFLHDTHWLMDSVRAAEANDSGIYGTSQGAVTITPEDKIDPKTLQQKFPGVPGLDHPTAMSVAQDMADAHAREQTQQNVSARYPSGFGHAVLGLGAGVVTGLLDPVDDAAFMVPVVGAGRYATWLARAGEIAGVFGRAGVTLGVGAMRGAAGQAILSGAHLALANDDYTLGQAATDTLYGAGAGALLHGAFSFKGDILGERFAQSTEASAANGNADLHDNALRVAASQMATGDPVEVRPVFDAARTRSDLMSSTALASTDFAASDRMDEAVGRATGTLTSPDEIRIADQAELAKANPPDAVMDAQLAEAKAAIDRMRAEGSLSPEDEAILAALERDEAQRNQPLAGGEGAEAELQQPGITVGAVRFAGPPEALEAARQDVALARGGVPSEENEPSLFQTIRKLGGIKMKDGAGNPMMGAPEIRQIMDTNRSLTNNGPRGRAPDMMREALEERGWFGNREVGQTDLADLHALIEREASGNKVYHPESKTAQTLEYHARLNEDLDHAGVTRADSPEDAAHKLAVYQAERSAQDEAWRTAGSTAGLDLPEDATPEEVLAAAIERDAIQAEANGTGEEFADHANEWIDTRLWEIAPDIADELKAEDLLYEPEPAEGSETPRDLAAGSEESGALAGDENSAGEFGSEPGQIDQVALGRQLDIPGSEPSAKQLAAARDARGRGRIGATEDQLAADHGLFAPPKRNEPTLFAKEETRDDLTDDEMSKARDRAAMCLAAGEI